MCFFQLTEFQAILKPHQQKRESNGMTLLEQATVEHNFLSLARIYKSISFQNLEQLLGISPEMIEKLATRLISTGMIKGSIDQIDRTITFEGENDVL